MTENVKATIPIIKLKAGYESAIENAECLLKDAQILYENECYASSIQLSLLSCEEAGKAYGIAIHLSQGKEISETLWEKGMFRSHLKKIFSANKALSLSLDNKLREAIQKHEADESLARFLGIDPHKDTIQWKAEWLKQHVTYLNYDFKKGQWLKPSTIWCTTASFANGLLNTAKKTIEAVRRESNRLTISFD